MVAEPGRPHGAERILDVLIPLIMEEIVQAVNAVPRERIAQRICEQIVNVDESQVAEQATEAPKTSNRDRTSQRTVEQILNVHVPEMAKQLVEVPETVSRDGVQQRTVEQIVDAPVPQAVEELAEVSKVFSQDRIQQRVVEQTTPATSLAEMTVEVPVARTPEKAQQVANTLIQHDVDTVEVERPQIIKQTWQKPIIQEKINQVTKHVEVPLVQFLHKVDEVPVGVQRQIPMVRAVQKTMEIPQWKCIDKMLDNPEVPQVHVVKKTVEDPQFENVQKTIENPENVPLQFMDKAMDIPVVAQRQTPQVQVSEKTVEISQLQAIEKIVETRETQMIQSTQTSESLKPDDPDAKTKFLAEEALHEIGGLIFDTHGNRVANELRGRNCVTGEMKKNKLPSRLDLNSAVSDDTAWQCKQYTGRGVRKLHESGTAPAEDMEALVLKTPDSIKAHYQASLKTARNPNGEPYPAFTSEKSWSEASGEIGSEKKFYHNVSSGADFAATVVAHRQVPLIQRVQKTVEVPRVQFIDRLVDDPDCTKKRRKAEGQDQDVDVERFSDLVLPSSQSCLCVSIASSDGEEEELKHEAEGTSLVQGGEHGREEDETDAQVPGSELVQMAPNMGAGGSHPQAMTDQERDKELREIRRMVEFLVHRERKLDVKTDVAARRLERLERESSQLKPASKEPSRTAPKS